MSGRVISGLRYWLLQRLSALYILLFLIVLAVVWGGEPLSFAVWQAWAAHPVANIALLFFVLALLLHAWIGLRDVIIDYVHSVAMRYVLLILIALGLFGLGFWSLRILLFVGRI